jgi:hypothetical protein
MSSSSDANAYISHQRMWEAFTRFATRGVIGVIVLVLFIGWITGVL